MHCMPMLCFVHKVFRACLLSEGKIKCLRKFLSIFLQIDGKIVAREMIIKPSQKLQAVWCYIIKMVLSATL